MPQMRSSQSFRAMSLDPRNRTLVLRVFAFASFLLFFQARWAMQVTAYDEACYVEYLHRFIGAAYPVCYSHSHPWGVSLLWVPVGLIARLIAGTTGLQLEDVLIPCLAIFSFSCWAISLFLLDRLVRLKFSGLSDSFGAESVGESREFPLGFSLLFFFALPALEYAARAPFYSHSGELLLTLLCYYSLLKNRWVIAGILGLWLCLTRPYDALIAVVFLGRVADTILKKGVDPKVGRMALYGGVTLLAVACIMGIRIGFITGYHGITVAEAFRTMKWMGFNRTFLSSAGVLWVESFCVFLLALGLRGWRKLSWMERASWLWLAFLFVLHLFRSKLFDELETRYLIGAYVGGILIFVSLYRDLSPAWQKAGVIIPAFQGLMQMLLYWTSPIHVFRHWEVVTKYNNSVFTAFAQFAHPLNFFMLGGLSPIPFSAFSWFQGQPFLSRFAVYAKYALAGPPLWILTLAWLVALAALLFSLRELVLRLRQTGRS